MPEELPREEKESTKVLIVEDERIIAENIERSLSRMGYEVTGICCNSTEVMDAVRQIKPNVVLMDIHIEGEEDGVTIAERLRDLYAVPVVYLSALMDDETLERAKITQPFGYIAKPFSQRELLITLEIALYKSQMEQRLADQEVQIQHIIDIGQGYCLLDDHHRIRYANRRLSETLDRELNDIVGKPAREFFDLPMPTDAEVYAAWIEQRSFETILRPKDGSERPVVLTAQHLYKPGGSYTGSFLSITDMSSVARLQKKA